MYYLTGTTKKNLPDFMGFMLTPKKGTTTLDSLDRVWAVDNGSFSGKFNEKKFFLFLEKMLPYRNMCLFCACPDFMCDPEKTLSLYEEYAYKIKDLGYPVAFIAQDGQENFAFPSEFDWLFVGGSTEWKLSSGAISCITKAKNLNKKIHIGRVNSYKRWKHFYNYGINSVDGNHMKYEPDKALERIIKWYEKLISMY